MSNIKRLIENYSDINCPYLNCRLDDNQKFDTLTLKEYIDIMKKHKELHIFRHDVHIDYNANDYVHILFGENNKVVVLDGLYRNVKEIKEVEDGYFYYKQRILDIHLESI